MQRPEEKYKCPVLLFCPALSYSTETMHVIEPGGALVLLVYFLQSTGLRGMCVRIGGAVPDKSHHLAGLMWEVYWERGRGGLWKKRREKGAEKMSLLSRSEHMRTGMYGRATAHVRRDGCRRAESVLSPGDEVFCCYVRRLVAVHRCA